MKLVLRLPHDHRSDSDSPAPSRPIRDKEARSPAAKATDARRGKREPEWGPTTALPDKKLLVFILDRLQKKDTYGVFSEPVDIGELPDYHDIIHHPMDFGTVRKKLTTGAYLNLEEFEKDVFLISSNAMTYNAADTIYYRQARAIHELAKKDFENLRQESDDNAPEPKVTRRGRPPSKISAKKMVGVKPIDRVVSNLSEATLANARDNGHLPSGRNDLSRKGSLIDKAGIADSSTRSSYGVRHSEPYSWSNDQKSDKNEENTGVQAKYGKRSIVAEENRRDTYMQSLASSRAHEPSILFAFAGERKQFLPVGIYKEHAYARSLARFAANLGPIGWEIATQRIQRALPSGMMFGRGWVGDSEAPKDCQPHLLSSSPPQTYSQVNLAPSCHGVSKEEKGLENHDSAADSTRAIKEELSSSVNLPPANDTMKETCDSTEGTDDNKIKDEGDLISLPSSGASASAALRPKAPPQFNRGAIIPPTLNGMNTGAFVFDPTGQAGKMARPTRSLTSFNMDATMTHKGVFDMVSSRSNNGVRYQAPNSGDFDTTKVSSNLVADSSTDAQGLGDSSQNPKPASVPPDLNFSFHSPGSPASGVVMDPQQQPDLALQLRR